jgi:signal transduction histidine kinase
MGRGRARQARALREREGEASELARRLLETEIEAARGRDEILIGASGEVLTPLASLSGLVARLRATAPEDAERREAVEAAMLREVHRIRHLVGQFLDYARLKARRELVVEARPTQLESILDQVASAFPPEDRVVVDAEGPLPAVQADPGRLAQILMSLVSNGVKFSRPGSGVTIGALAAGDAVEVSVRDRGPGIPEAEQAHLFDELHRGRNAEEVDGVGLGLYLCRLLAEAQGAAIRVDSTPGEGTTFALGAAARARGRVDAGAARAAASAIIALTRD